MMQLHTPSYLYMDHGTVTCAVRAVAATCVFAGWIAAQPVDSLPSPDTAQPAATAEVGSPADTGSGVLDVADTPAVEDSAPAPAIVDKKAQLPDSLHELDRIVVTATRSARRTSEIPASVTVIGREEIDMAPARNVGDLLATKVGVVPRRISGMGDGVPGNDINIRGVPSAFSASRVLILVDGFPTNVSGTSLNLINQIPLAAIERIEVLRGPFSCLYGANAFAGVINTITREGDGRPRFELSGGGGTWGYWNVEGWSGGGNGKASYSLAAGARTIGNYFGSDSALGRKGVLTAYKAAENYGYRDERVLGKVRLQVTPALAVSLHARFYDSDVGFGKTKKDTLTPGDSVSANVNIPGTEVLAGPELVWKVSRDLNVRLWGFYRYVGGEFQGEDVAYIDTTPDTLTGAARRVDMYEESKWKTYSSDGQGQVEAALRLGGSNILSAGAEVLRNDIRYGPTLNRATGEELLYSQDTAVAIINGGVFVQDEIRLWDRLFAVPGVRLDFHSQFGAALSPRLATSFQPVPDLTLRASVGRGFRAPTLSELYMPPLMFSAGVSLISNPDLMPEYLWAVDAGAEQRIRDVVVLRVNGFYNLMDDLINPMIVSKYIYGTQYVSYRNINRAWSAGAELEAESQILRALWLTASYTYQETRDETFDVPLDYAPRHKIGASLRTAIPLGKWTLGGMVTGTHVGKRHFLEWQAPSSDWNIRYDPAADPDKPLSNSKPPLISLDDYATVDANVRISYRNHVWVGGDILNITDVIYQESGSTIAPRRMFSASVGVKF